MAEDRMLRADMRTSEKVNGWPIPLRYFWSQLWGYCDDHGRGRYDSRLIVADTFPIDDDVTAAVVGRWMQALEMAGVIRAYEVNGVKYFACVNWDEHQEISYLKRTKVPDQFGVIPPPGKRSGKVQNVPELSGPSKGEGEVKEKEKEKGNAETATPFCPKHPSGTTDKCGACGNARRAFDAAALASKNAPTPSPRKGTVTADTCEHKFVAGWCVAGCESREEGLAS